MTPRPSTRPTAPIRPRKKHYCDCSQHCKGRQTEVHRSTYQRHALVRQADLEKRLARYRTPRDVDDSSISAGPSLEEGGANRAPQTQESQMNLNTMEIGEPQVRHAAIF